MEPTLRVIATVRNAHGKKAKETPETATPLLELLSALAAYSHFIGSPRECRVALAGAAIGRSAGCLETGAVAKGSPRSSLSGGIQLAGLD